MWGLLGAVSWMLLMWYALTNVTFAAGDFGDVAFISICIGASSFILINTNIKIREQKIAQSDKEFNESGGNPGRRETSDKYYDRLDRLTHPKKK
jgi:hypothetical protein